MVLRIEVHTFKPTLFKSIITVDRALVNLLSLNYTQDNQHRPSVRPCPSSSSSRIDIVAGTSSPRLRDGIRPYGVGSSTWDPPYGSSTPSSRPATYSCAGRGPRRTWCAATSESCTYCRRIPAPPSLWSRSTRLASNRPYVVLSVPFLFLSLLYLYTIAIRGRLCSECVRGALLLLHICFVLFFER